MEKIKLLWLTPSILIKTRGILDSWAEEMENIGFEITDNIDDADVAMFMSDSEVRPELLGKKVTICNFWGWMPERLLYQDYRQFAEERLTLMAQCDRIIVPSPVTRDQVWQFGLPCHICFPGVDVKILDRAPPQVRERKILFISRLAPQKNLHLLIEAISMLEPSVPLLVFGPGDRTPYQELATRLGVSVTFAEPTDYEKAVELKRAAVLAHPCHSEDTKIATKEGLKSIDELKPTDLVWSLNAQNQLELSPIKRIYKSYYEGNMVSFANEQVNLLVTPNHRIYYATQKKRRTLQVRQAGNFIGLRTRYYLPTTGLWHGKITDTIKPSDIGAIKGLTAVSKNLLSEIDLGDLLELIGWYISEGYLRIFRNRGWKEQYVSFTNTNIDYKRKIFNILKKFNLNPFYNGTKDIRVYSAELVSILSQCGIGSKNKTIPDWCLEYSPSLLKRLYDSLMAGDGSRKGHHVLYYTSSDKLKDKFIELSMKLGFSCKVFKRQFKSKYGETKDWMISIREKLNKGCVKAGKHVSLIPYKGNIWCLQTENCNFLTSRNGLMTFSGNSSYEGWGLPPLEALASGTPVIAADTPHMRWLLQEDAYFFTSIEGLAGTIKEVVNNPDEAFSKAAHGQQRIRGSLTLEHSAQRLWWHIHETMRYYLGKKIRQEPEKWATWYDMEHRRNWNYSVERLSIDWLRHWRMKYVLAEAVGPKVLDIGAGAGVYTIGLAREGHQVTWNDVSEEALRQATYFVKKFGVSEKVTFCLADCCNLSLNDNTFDSVWMGELLEHILDPLQALKEALRVTKKGGKVIFSTPAGFAFDSCHFDPMHLHRWTKEEFQSSYLEPLPNIVIERLEEIGEEGGIGASCLFGALRKL